MRVEGTGKSEGRPPLPLLIGFGVFLVAMAYLLTASFTRRTAPTFAPAATARGDTLTIDATDGARWQYVSLTSARVLSAPDTAGWELAVRRYNLIAAGDAVDLGPAAFDSLRDAPTGRAAADSAITRWYQYSFLTHLLESKRHVYAVRTSRGTYFKVQVLSYYCPGLTAGCVTVRYAPLRVATATE